MAEKYGEVPPRFTRAWWDYFWYYYKWRVVITAVAVLIAAVTVVQCANRPKYDMTVIYAGHMNYSDKETERLTELLNECITDIDGNGEPSVDFQRLMFSGSIGNEDYDYAMQTKVDMSFTENTTAVYLMDREEAELYLNRDSVADAFTDTDIYAADTDAAVLNGADGIGYAIDLSGSAILNENEIYNDDLYVLVRKYDENNEETAGIYKNAINIAKKLIE